MGEKFFLKFWYVITTIKFRAADSVPHLLKRFEFNIQRSWDSNLGWLDGKCPLNLAQKLPVVVQGFSFVNLALRGEPRESSQLESVCGQLPFDKSVEYLTQKGNCEVLRKMNPYSIQRSRCLTRDQNKCHTSSCLTTPAAAALPDTFNSRLSVNNRILWMKRKGVDRKILYFQIYSVQCLHQKGFQSIVPTCSGLIKERLEF